MNRAAYGERVAAVETELKALRTDVKEMRDDVKTLLAVHERQKGAARVLALLWAGLLSLGGLLSGLFMGRGHG